MQILLNIHKKGIFSCKYSNDKSIELSESDIDITYLPIDNYISIDKENILLLLNTSRNDELIIKGLVRDLSRNIQQLRKELGFNPTEILSCVYISNVSTDEIINLKKYYDDIKNLVRVKDVIFSKEVDNKFDYKTINIDGKELEIFIH